MKKIFIISACLLGFSAFSQQSITVQQAIDSALIRNKIIQIKALQSEEKQFAKNELLIRRLPNLTVMGAYTYSLIPTELTLKAGTFGPMNVGPLPLPALPTADVTRELAVDNLFIGSAIVAQPLTQQFKITNGVRIQKIEQQIVNEEKHKLVLQVKQGVEKMYLAILIKQKEIETAEANVRFASSDLKFTEDAVAADKAISANAMGLKATLLDEKQKLLKLQMEIENLLTDFQVLTGLAVPATSFQPYEVVKNDVRTLEEYKTLSQKNPDFQIAALQLQKSQEAIKASKNSYIPDLSLIGIYAYQNGIEMLNNNHAFIGLNLKWNLSDMLINKQQQNQREGLEKQAKLSLEFTQEQANKTIETLYRKRQQSLDLLEVTKEVLAYRKQELQIVSNKLEAGLTTPKEVDSVSAKLAKAEADFYSAQLNYHLIQTDLNVLIGE